jgi:hypothetical protein
MRSQFPEVMSRTKTWPLRLYQDDPYAGVYFHSRECRDEGVDDIERERVARFGPCQRHRRDPSISGEMDLCAHHSLLAGVANIGHPSLFELAVGPAGMTGLINVAANEASCRLLQQTISQNVTSNR